MAWLWTMLTPVLPFCMSALAAVDPTQSGAEMQALPQQRLGMISANGLQQTK